MDSVVKPDVYPESVALVSPGWPPGSPPNGIVSYTARLRAALVARGVRAHVLAWHVGSGADARRVHAIEEERPRRTVSDRVLDKLRFHLTPTQKYHQYRQRLLHDAFVRLARHDDVDVIETSESFGDSLALRKDRILRVVRLHGPWFLNGPAVGAAQDAAYTWRVEVEGRAIAQADAVSAPSQDVLDQTRRYYDLPLSDAVVIPNPLDEIGAVPHWRLETADSRRILFVGRFDRHKGGDIVIRAFARVLARMPDAVLSFAGPDNGLIDESGQRHNLEQYLRDHLTDEQRKRVEVLGAQTQQQLQRLRMQAQVTLIPSRYENFPYTALEAMDAGCPVIASRTGGLAEIVAHDRNGLLFAPGSADELSHAVLSLLWDSARAARLGRQAAEDVRGRYDPVTIAVQTLDFYAKMLERKRRATSAFRAGIRS